MSKAPHDADSLAQRLDETLPAGGVTAPRDDPDPLVGMAARLANAPHPKMPPEMAAQIRSQVLAAQRLQKQTRPVRFHPAFYWAAVAGVIAFVLFGLQPAVLASVPGSALYPLKRTIESLELLAAGATEAQAFTHLLHAERRAQEAAVLAEQGQIESDLFAAALEQIAAAAQAARSDPVLPAAVVSQLEARIAQINTALGSALRRAQESSLVPESTLAPLATSVWATQTSGALSVVTAAPSLTPTATLTQTSTAAVTTAPTATPTPTSPLTETPTAAPTQTPSATAPAATPTPMTAPPQVFVTADPAGLNWDDNADCSNPPPAWAPAVGWRARCEGAAVPPAGGSNPGPPPGAGRPGGAGPPPRPGRP